MSKAISYAVGILEVGRAMGLTVATPTTGSSGVIAGVLLSMQERFELSDEKMIQALFHAGAIGYLITRSGIALARLCGLYDREYFSLIRVYSSVPAIWLIHLLNCLVCSSSALRAQTEQLSRFLRISNVPQANESLSWVMTISTLPCLSESM